MIPERTDGTTSGMNCWGRSVRQPSGFWPSIKVELLGKSFDTDTAFGAVTTSILLTVKEDGLAGDFGREGLLRVYLAFLDVAIKQPGLFVVKIKKTNIGRNC